MIDYETYCKIRDHRDRQGLTITHTARALGLHPETVSKWSRRERYQPRAPVKRGSQLDPYKGQILEAHPLSAQQVFQRLREDGYPGGLTIVGPVGVGKTFLAHALGHIACRHAHSVLALRADKMLKTLKHARLDNSYEAELREFLAVDLLICDDFALDSMDAVESRDAHEIITERHRAGSMIFTSNRGPDEWLPMFADRMRAQSAIDRLTGNAYDLVIEGESYRQRLKPRLSAAQPARTRAAAETRAQS